MEPDDFIDRIDEDSATAHLEIEPLRPWCRVASFAEGEVLCREGVLHTEMYVILSGEAVVSRSGLRTLVLRKAGAPVGEICFLKGWPATATVTARTALEVLVVDDPALARMEKQAPETAATFLQRLAGIAEERSNANLTLIWERELPTRSGADVMLCRTPDMVAAAQRLRYAVYVEELKYETVHADHARKVLADPLDDTAHILVAMEGGEVVGTLRANHAGDSELGALADLYGMRASRHFPHAALVATKFVIAPDRRGTSLALKLIAALTQLGLRQNVRECFIDSIPDLVPYYRALGFDVAGPAFFHCENGPSLPMKVDLGVYGERLIRDPGSSEVARIRQRADGFRTEGGAAARHR